MQWEVAGRLGPGPGRYVVRRYAGDVASHVVVVETVQSPARRSWWRRRRAGAGTTRLTRATVVSTEELEHAAASQWLRAAEGERAEGLVTAALTVLNQTVQAHRLPAADPHATGLTRTGALLTRVGYGTGEQVAEGRWVDARELPPPRASRPAGHPAEERVAALLAGRDAALACEELVLRARLDADQGREREAALQLRAALEVALAELAGWREVDGMAARLDELRALGRDVQASARAALEGGLAPEEFERVRVALGRLEAALRARSAAELDRGAG